MPIYDNLELQFVLHTHHKIHGNEVAHDLFDT